MNSKRKQFSKTRERIHEIIFEADTKAGKYFDIILFIFIIASVLTVVMETVGDYAKDYHMFFFTLEIIFTIFFTLEYFIRLYCVFSPKKYATSFYGIIDLLSILPTYLSFFLVGTQSLLVIRALRLLRIFRIFKLGKFLKESAILVNALKESRAKITVFLVFIILMVTIIGSIMYLIEGPRNSEEFSSIPRSIYWAIVTLTTVGYGDIHPITTFGQFLASLLMIMGYAIIAVPTGIVSSELMSARDEEVSTNTQACRNCSQEGHDDNALYCKFCGFLLNEE